MTKHTMVRTALSVSVVLAALVVGDSLASAAELPGEPCSKPGEVKPLGAGAIECINGTWAPSSKPAAGAPVGNATGAPAAPPKPAAAAKTAGIFKSVGPVLTQDTFGGTGKQVADPTAIRLADGRIRLYSWVNPTGLRTATSTDATGTKFVADSVAPLKSMAGQPRAVRVDASRIRLFYTSAGTITAAISTDNGLTFTEEGPVITSAQAGFEPGTLSLVRVAGGYRAYFSNLEKPGVQAERVMRTATSTDMLTWTMGPQLAMSGSHPFALTDAKGRIALYYAADRGASYGIFMSTSANGTAFGSEKFVISGGGDPDIISSGKNKWLMYYGSEVSPSLGFGVLVARSLTNAIPK
ncbi:MAG: exo-alpha-sialidase [Actinomycetota bacterium]|nr:exo-alpha-sialidase [Actinomycetota bacterium]